MLWLEFCAGIICCVFTGSGDGVQPGLCPANGQYRKGHSGYGEGFSDTGRRCLG